MDLIYIETEIQEFPESLDCIIVDGYQSKLVKRKRYLGNRSFLVDKNTIKAKVLIKNDTDAITLARWWAEDLDYGNNTFTILVKFFGVIRKWKVKIKNDLTNPLKFALVSDVTMELELVEQFAPILHLPLKDSFAMKAGEGSVTFTRNTTATYIHGGVFKTASINESRFEDDWFLTEGESTNLLLQSASYTNTESEWSKNGLIDVVESSTQKGTDGETYTFEIVEDTTTGAHYISQTIPHADIADNSSVTHQVKAKPKGRGWIYLTARKKDGTVLKAWFNVSTGVKGTVESGLIATISEKLNNDFYLCTITYDSDTGANDFIHRLGIADADNSSSYVGDGVNGVYAEHPQMEELGSDSSYIPTTTERVTRGADLCLLKDVENSCSVSNGMTYSLEAKAYSLSDAVLFDANNSQKRLSIDSGVIKMKQSIGALTTTHTPVIGIATKYLSTYVEKTGVQKAYINGIYNATKTQLNTGTDATKIAIGSTAGGASSFYGHIRNVRIWERDLIAEEAIIA